MSGSLSIQIPVHGGAISVSANDAADLGMAALAAVQAYRVVTGQIVEKPNAAGKFFYNHEYQGQAKFFPATGLKLHSQALGSLCGLKITATDHTDGQRLRGTLCQIHVDSGETRCDVIFDGWNHSRSVSLSDVQFVENE